MSNTKPPNLKPCPFCGSGLVGYWLDTSQGQKWGSVYCANCDAKGPDVRTNYKNSESEPWHVWAAKEWNERVGHENKM